MFYVMIWKSYNLNGYQCAGKYASYQKAHNQAPHNDYVGANGSKIKACIWDEKTYQAWLDARD